jgi:hypothetical protein
MLQEIKITKEEAANIEQLTRKQSLSMQWYDHRSGRLTASNFYSACHTNVRNPSVSLIRKIMNYVPIVQSPAINWGKSKEETAFNVYKGLMEKHHSGFLVRQSGLVINPAYPTLGASPDGVTDCPCCGKGLLEIKCPYKYLDAHPCEVNAQGFYVKSHPCATIPFKNQIKLCGNYLRKTSNHFYQVQGQMAICDVDFCDFVCWTPKGIHIERVQRDAQFIEGMLKQLQDFFLKAIMPELLTESKKLPTKRSRH